MAWRTYHTRKLGEHTLASESQMMGYGYDPSLSEGALRPPIFPTSTFTFETAQQGKDFFDVTLGRHVTPEGKQSGLRVETSVRVSKAVEVLDSTSRLRTAECAKTSIGGAE